MYHVLFMFSGKLLETEVVGNQLLRLAHSADIHTQHTLFALPVAEVRSLMPSHPQEGPARFHESTVYNYNSCLSGDSQYIIYNYVCIYIYIHMYNPTFSRAAWSLGDERGVGAAGLAALSAAGAGVRRVAALPGLPNL